MKDFSPVTAKQNELFQIIRFGLVGAFCAALDIIFFIILYDYLKINYLIANFGSTCFAILINYYISKKWVFKSGKYSARVEFAAFMIFSIIGLVINQFLIWLFVERFFMNPKTGKIIAIILVAIFNFITKKIFVFKK